MSIQAVGWVLDQEDIPARAKLVLVAIANHASHTDGYCWLKIDTIAKEAACSPRAVFNFLGALIRNGYVRKAPRRGDDGKQRANDYWILFNRTPAKWIKAADEADHSDSEHNEAETQDVVQPDARDACGEDTVPDVPPPVDKPAGACGPTAPACSHIDSVEPSKIKPEEDARARARPPRHYRPPPAPPPQPMGSIADRAARQIFVYEGSRAWIAWCDFKKRTTGADWTLSRSTVIDGKVCTGWWFPSLFPPSDSRAETTDPPETSSAA